ncbi:MAG: OmpA family protein [Bacteroidales bacterium]|nr:OmpA family protein [Bacteroidales bacterium]
MRSLIIGILLFIIWATLSTWYYSTRIFISDNDTAMELAESQIAITTDALPQAVEPDLISPPETLRIYYAVNRSDFVPDERLGVFIEQSKLYLQAKPSACLLITGHTDSNGSEAYNHSLGWKRANVVKAYCMTMGLSQVCIKTDSKGESEPEAENTTEEGQAKNRRSVLEIQP